MNLIRPYAKIVDLGSRYACVAIYTPNPFRDDNIDCPWYWVYYDWCCNPVAISREAPEGRLTYKLKPEDFEWMGHDNAVRYCEYLNKEPNVEMKREWELKYGQC